MSSMPTPRDTAGRGSLSDTDTTRQSIGFEACLNSGGAASRKWCGAVLVAHRWPSECILCSMVRVSIVGAAGYTGQETLDRVLGHPQLGLVAVGSDSLAGQPGSALDPRHALEHELGDARAKCFDLARFLHLGGAMIVMPEGFIYIGPVCHLVQDRFGVGPKPCNWPEQPTKAKRQQTQAMNRVGLWMLFLMSDFFRHDVDQPENGDADNRRDHEYDPRDAIGD